MEINYRLMFIKEFTRTVISNIAKNHVPTNPIIPIQRIEEPNEIIFVKSAWPDKITGIKEMDSPKPATMVVRPQQTSPVRRPTPLPITPPLQGYIDLGKINVLLRDNWVQSIDCSGANKNITVKKGSRNLITNIKLTNEEITELINELSLATKVPIVEGMFRAAYNNLMITAAVSEFLGSRFLIQKHNLNFNY